MKTILFAGQEIPFDDFLGVHLVTYQNSLNLITDLGPRLTRLSDDERKSLIEAIKFIKNYEKTIEINDFESQNSTKTNPQLTQLCNKFAEYLPTYIKLQADGVHTMELYTAMMSQPFMKKYFKDFSFKVLSGHNDGEFSPDKNIRFPLKFVQTDAGTFIFRWMEVLDELLNYHKGYETTHGEVIAYKFFTAKVRNTCFTCSEVNELIIDHENKAVVDREENKCFYAGQNLDTLNCEVATTGKLFICNDLRNIMSDEQIENLNEQKYSTAHKMGVSASLNDIQGQQFNVNHYAQNLKAAYVVAGNHGCAPKAYSPTEIKLHYWEKGFKNISLALWGVFIMDYENAKQLALNSGKLDVFESMESVILNVEPGTYRVTSILQDDCSDDALPYFSEITKISDVTEFQSFSDKDWVSKINFN